MDLYKRIVVTDYISPLSRRLKHFDHIITNDIYRHTYDNTLPPFAH